MPRRRRRSSAKARSQRSGMEMSAFAEPASLRKGKADSRVAQVLDAIGAGVTEVDIFDLNAPKPKKIKSISVKRKKQGLHKYSGPYTSFQILQLGKEDTRVGETLVALSAADSVSGWGEARKVVELGNRDAISYVMAVAYQAIIVQDKSVSSVRTKLEAAAQNIAEVSNEAKMHPVDVIDLAREGLLIELQRYKASSPGTWMRTSGQVGGLLNRFTKDASSTIAVYKSVKAATKRMTKARLGTIRSAAEFVRKALGKMTPVSTLKNAKPFKVPTTSAKVDTIYGAKVSGSKPVFGFEIEEIQYDVEDPETGDSKTFTHRTAACVAEKRANNPQELVYLLKNHTPCGRVWLCWSNATKSMFIASDKRPSKKLFMSGERNDALSLLYSNSTEVQPLWGFVF